MVIVIPNDKLLDIVPNLAINAANKLADELLMRSMKRGEISEMIIMPCLVHLDLAELKTMFKRGGAFIGLHHAEEGQ